MSNKTTAPRKLPRAYSLGEQTNSVSAKPDSGSSAKATKRVQWANQPFPRDVQRNPRDKVVHWADEQIPSGTQAEPDREDIETRAGLLACLNTLKSSSDGHAWQQTQALRLCLQQALPDAAESLLPAMLDTINEFHQADDASEELLVLLDMCVPALNSLAVQVRSSFYNGLDFQGERPSLAQESFLAATREISHLLKGLHAHPAGCEILVQLLQEPEALGKVDQALLRKMQSATDRYEFLDFQLLLKDMVKEAPGLPAQAGQLVTEAGRLLKICKAL